MTWRKSSRSSEAGDNCVEVADAGGLLAVRDSQNPDGPRHTFTLTEMMTLFQAIKAGRFDL
ncbi:DUF397 domain-containing protein [Actinomadura miaoliensis]|uniref:DUF397 domain-containing protein n=1 Tax=Actinomadura miaoliensis TaxID=430685 RepID=UPI0031EEC783